MKANSKIGFGLDLAGYTSKKTSLAVIEPLGDHAKVTLLRGSPLSMERSTGDALQVVTRAEAEAIEQCLALGTLAVDVPIDLQGLPLPLEATQIWGLSKRAVDREFKALPPLADKIGASVARFAAISRNFDLDRFLGVSLFETYPAPFVRQFPDAKDYKLSDRAKEDQKARSCLALCRRLNLNIDIFNDDDLDAIICALAAVVDDSNLFGIQSAVSPKGYRVLQSNPFCSVEVVTMEFRDWVGAVS